MTITFSNVTAVIALAVSIGTLARMIYSGVAKARQPTIEQNKRIAKDESFLETDYKRINELEETSKITQRALLALLKHAIDGNDIKALKDSEKEIQNYLIEK